MEGKDVVVNVGKGKSLKVGDNSIEIMLYVFLVDTGTMMAFDMNLALESVSQLKQVIERASKIPADKQVLLISGGESLDSAARVCSYSAGTDTNPIFLFSKSTIESSVPPSPSIDIGSDTDLKEQVDGSLQLPPTYMTVVARSQLAQQFHDIAKEQTRACERLVHDQHLQQQGWAAVVANLEDITSAFRTRMEVFEQSFLVYLENREPYLEVLKDFSSVLDLLGRIPILQPLLKGDCEQQSSIHSLTLLQWIGSKDHQNRLEMVAEQCEKGLEQLNHNVYDGLQAEIRQTLDSVNSPNMKEVKGLEERLYGLDQLLFDARKIVQEQSEMAQAFLQNQTRAGHLGDSSVLPDLCASHRKQLMVMLSNHQHLRDIHRRCIRAKEELSANLHTRLRWIMYVERAMSDVDNKLVIYYENLKRLKRHLEVVQQIHLAPEVYLSSVVEVVRRKAFSKQFQKWSRVLSNQAADLHKKEVLVRKEFHSKVGNHFLFSLFPGLDDIPPPYALQAPPEFDRELPDIRLSDVENLRVLLPEMASSLNVPDVDAVPGILNLTLDYVDALPTRVLPDDTREQPGKERPHPILVSSQTTSFASEPVPHRECSLSTITEVQPMVLTSEVESVPKADAAEVGLVCHDALESPRDPEESEPDTEEFEKVEGGIGVPECTGDREVTEDDAAQNRLRLQEIEACLKQMRVLENEAVVKLRIDVGEARKAVLQNRDDLLCQLTILSSQVADAFATMEQRITTEKNRALQDLQVQVHLHHQAAMDELHQRLEMESSELSNACANIQNYQDQLQRSNELIERLKLEMAKKVEEQRQQLVAEHQEAIKRMTLEHELEFDSLKELQIKETTVLEQTLKDTQENLESKLKELDHLKSQQTLLEEGLLKKFQDECEKQASSLEACYLERERSAVQKAVEDAQDDFRKMEERLHREADDRVKRACEELKEELQAAAENERLQLCRDWEVEKELIIKDQREQLAKEHKQEMEGLRARFRLAFNTAQGMERSPSDSSLEKIERPDSADPSRTEQQLALLRAELDEKEATVAELQRAHQLELYQLLQKYEKDRQDLLKSMKASLTAEKQVVFNEAVNKATAEKESVIRDLRLQISKLKEEVEFKQFTGSLLSSGTESSPIKSQPDSGNFQMVSPMLPRRSESASCLLGASVVVSPISEQPSNLEMSVHVKKSETCLAEMAETTSTSVVEQLDKVSVFTCIPGDLVLLYYDERYENYVVFTAGTTYYFLNHDCHELLNLTTTPGEMRKKWVLARVTEKEYCQARKEQNRFRVPMGTRFYRIRAKPWSRESVMRQSLTTSAKKKSSLTSMSGIH